MWQWREGGVLEEGRVEDVLLINNCRNRFETFLFVCCCCSFDQNPLNFIYIYFEFSPFKFLTYWSVFYFWDPNEVFSKGFGEEQAEPLIRWVKSNLQKNLIFRLRDTFVCSKEKYCLSEKRGGLCWNQKKPISNFYLEEFRRMAFAFFALISNFS